MREAFGDTAVHWVRFQVVSDNRNCLSGRPKRSHYRWTNCEYHIDVRGDYFRRQRSNPRRVAIGDPQNKLDLRRRAIAR
jgi:hypothetical protein